MKILLVSDNHGDKSILKTIMQRFGNQVDGLFHCGDSNLASSLPIMTNFRTVMGNTDQGMNYPKVITQQIGDQVVTVTHGHLYHVNMTMTPLLLLAQETQADVVAFGHTHQLAVTMEDNRLLINPGSISYPRGQYADIGGTFAIVEATKDYFNVQYYDRKMQALPNLKFSWHRTK